MADNFTTKHEQKRKDYFNIHPRAFLSDKLPCPHEECQYNLSCYDQDGLDHHYRTNGQSINVLLFQLILKFKRRKVLLCLREALKGNTVMFGKAIG